MMKSFDRALDDCLGRISRGEALETCLNRYAQYAGELRPLLQTAVQLEKGTRVHVTESFKQRGRNELLAYMEAHPRSHGLGRTSRSPAAVIGKPSQVFGPVRLVTGVFAVLVFAFFATGTALAQSALPGQSLYSWKLTSETVWRTISPDPVSTNLALAARRTQEALAVTGSARSVALKGYEAVLSQLAIQSRQDASAQHRIVPVLTDQRNDLAKSGISVPELDDYLTHPGQKPEGDSHDHQAVPTAQGSEPEKPPKTPPIGKVTPTPTPEIGTPMMSPDNPGMPVP